jgi:DNA phosphorothioation-dependent restriction protein DptF
VCESGMLAKVNDDKLLKSALFNLITRLQYIEDDNDNEKIYRKYLSDLYMFNSGNGKKLGQLYGMVEKGVTKWCGSDEDGNICLEERQSGFSLFETVKFKANIDHLPKPRGIEELHRFIPSVVTAFEDMSGEIIYLEIDYSLYELIYKLNQGYIQTADDRNNHADFISFINRILQTGSLTENISIVSVNGKKASISRSMFGYKFKVVK